MSSLDWVARSELCHVNQNRAPIRAMSTRRQFLAQVANPQALVNAGQRAGHALPGAHRSSRRTRARTGWQVGRKCDIGHDFIWTLKFWY
jgi:hypothetical protein